jgi:hypothetical protein
MLHKKTEPLGVLNSPLLLSGDKPELMESTGQTGSSDEEQDDQLLPKFTTE